VGKNSSSADFTSGFELTMETIADKTGILAKFAGKKN
jgi:hypothetical protein